MSLKALADELAKHGRYGDTQLLHVHKDELAGLASLAPGGKLTINPKTGLPEAFFFLPFLASLFGGGAATAAAAPAIAAATGAGGALASGLATGITAATTAGLPTAAAALPAAASALPAAATALPAAGIDALTTGSISAAPIASAAQAAALPSATIGANAAPLVVGTQSAGVAAPLASTPAALGGAAPGAIAMPAAPAAVSPIATPAAAAAAPVAPAPAGAAMSPAVMPVEATPGTGVGAFSGSTAAKGGLDGMVSSGIKGLANMNPLTMMMLGQGISSIGNMFKKDKSSEDSAPDISGTDYHSTGGTDPVFPDRGYKPGKDNEWDYFPGMAQGGLVGYAMGGRVMPQTMSQHMGMMPQNGFVPTMRTQSSVGQPMPVRGSAIPPMPVTMSQQIAGQQRQGPVQGYAQGGITSLANPPPGAGMLNGQPQSTMPPQQMPGQPMEPGMSPDPNQIPTSPYPKSQVGAPSDGDKELIAQTVAAIKGRHPNPNGILMAFIQQFGEQALQDLVARVKGGAQGPASSDGLSDSIPATIGGQQPAALSEGEFVVPSDVVSHLGNGSTDAGAGHLQNMVARTRAARGAPQTPPQIDASQMMPA